MNEDDEIIIYTDGSSKPNPRRGGMGIRFLTNDKNGYPVTEDLQPDGYMNATNQQMELYACVVALKEARDRYNLKAFSRITIKTDSQYVTSNKDTAIYTWSTNKWITFDGKPVDNAPLWKELIKELTKVGRKVDFKWVKGHSKDEHNNAVDRLAKQSADSARNSPLFVVSVRRKTTKKMIKPGSVDTKGQRLIIRIITTEYLRTQRLYKYNYEVKSKGSKYHGCADKIYSEHLLRDGHCYSVTLNKAKRNPKILKVLNEINCNTGEKLN